MTQRTKVNSLNPSPLDALKELIHRGEQLCDRDRHTEENELDKFKQDALLLLGSIGPVVEALYWRVTELDFRTPYRKSRYTHTPGRDILDPIEAYRTLDELVGILKSAEARMLTLQDEGAEQPRQNKLAKAASKATPYSPRDHAIYELIGPAKFTHMGNDVLYRQFRRRLRTELEEDIEYNAFRLAANRIRKYRGLPSSEAVKKSDQP